MYESGGRGTGTGSTFTNLGLGISKQVTGVFRFLEYCSGSFTLVSNRYVHLSLSLIDLSFFSLDFMCSIRQAWHVDCFALICVVGLHNW